MIIVQEQLLIDCISAYGYYNGNNIYFQYILHYRPLKDKVCIMKVLIVCIGYQNLFRDTRKVMYQQIINFWKLIMFHLSTAASF